MRHSLPFLAILLATGCGPSKEEIRLKEIERVRTLLQHQIDFYKKPLIDSLKDPASVQIRNEGVTWDSLKIAMLGPESKVKLLYCFEVNAKNSYGAYTGFEAREVNILAFPNSEENNLAVLNKQKGKSITLGDLFGLGLKPKEQGGCGGNLLTLKAVAERVVDHNLQDVDVKKFRSIGNCLGYGVFVTNKITAQEYSKYLDSQPVAHKDLILGYVWDGFDRHSFTKDPVEKRSLVEAAEEDCKKIGFSAGIK